MSALDDATRRHPDYADGYEAGFHERPAKTGGREYLAGFRAGLSAALVFREAGMTREPGGSFTISGSVASNTEKTDG